MTNLKKHIFCLIAVLSFGFQLIQSQTTTLVSIDANGKLTYKPDSKGTVIPDFSGVGYQNSEKPIPVVPVVKTVTAVVGDNVANVQTAINAVAAMPLVNGIRGAILFKAGTYEMSTTINVTASGIVLRGEGQTTIFKATGIVQYDLIHIIGASGKTDITSSQKMVTDAFVPVGVKSVTVQSVQPFAVGDWVHFRREPNDAWIHMLGMDTLSKIDPLATDWTASGYKISYERKITNIQGNILTFDAPVMDIIDPVYANAFVVKFTSGRISNCAVENLKMTSAYTSSTDELHGWNAIFMDNVENCWVKKVNAYSFGYSCVNVNDGGAFVTVDSCSMLDAISQITGGRRYSFNLNGQRCLVQNCITRNGRHDFVDGSRTPGPNVFYNSTATQEHADIGPHHRWSTGILFDNISTDGQIRVQDRADSGSGHGWSGAQILFWNCTSPDFVVQDPPSYHCNWAVGCVGPITNVGQWTTNPLGIVESKGTKIVAIPSLFKAQLADRLKGLATVVEIPINMKSDFQILPNPASNEIQVKISLIKPSEIQLNICDLSGKSIKKLLSNKLTEVGITNYAFKTNNLKSGIYFIQLTSSDFQKSSKLIIKN
ncbi:MAG: T9SS type A sorting domain-containing protein [Paludibacter sp.]